MEVLAQSPRTYLPAQAALGERAAVVPYFDELAERAIASVGELERWLKDLSELEAALSKCKAVRPRIVHDGDNYLSAERIVARLIDEYNNVRLHAALGYFEPREVHFGNIAQRREVRRQKLETAREQRRTQNRSLMAA